jgi:hypothetical protein
LRVLVESSAHGSRAVDLSLSPVAPVSGARKIEPVTRFKLAHLMDRFKKPNSIQPTALSNDPYEVIGSFCGFGLTIHPIPPIPIIVKLISSKRAINPLIMINSCGSR